MKNVIITEDVEHEIVSDILSKAFYPDHKIVMEIKAYLDDNFIKKEMDDIDANGYPRKSHSVALTSNGQELKVMQLDELLTMLEDKFHEKIKDDMFRKKFLKQVIIDWWNKKIDRNGVLSVNYIK